MHYFIHSIRTFCLFCFVSYQPFVFSDDDFIRGVDLSSANQMVDCGVVFYDQEGPKNVYQIMSEQGGNLARIRVWVAPFWKGPDGEINRYSSLSDVKKSIQQAKNYNMKVLLDFHYSDTWADPGAQIIPKSWRNLLNDTEQLANKLYDYTDQVLAELVLENLRPDYVQIGNEIDREILLPWDDSGYPIDWKRNAMLLNAAIKAARKPENGQPQIIIHLAKASSAMNWFSDAKKAGLIDFDIIGLSYYAQWSTLDIEQFGEMIKLLKISYSKEVMIVETALPWTEQWNDNLHNVLATMPKGYRPATPENQAFWLLQLKKEAQKQRALGIIYWEPAWVSNNCSASGFKQKRGSSWENATFFDFDNRLIENGGVKLLSP
ncbi:glycoside hydrolase family 53 protein [Psychromonas antarctica]|uniref:glycoside hydrolase family 53 protein n=1 Tax=Psychromonas antarctica TaxID=67573 RepID=UPI001EE8D555|nr:glycosyl hydrolase 53 family protein [Psychromonas antarctica]MCG6201838.1 arabinogalactan endo-1,4-beta-galactosidase [Psychromonas antarctica]